MKKEYQKPYTTDIELKTSHLMIAVSGESGSTGVGNGTTDDNDPALSTHNRGVWGNLWQ